jgi:hypothetical protein
VRLVRSTEESGAAAIVPLPYVLLRPLDVNAWRKGTWDGTATVFWNNIPVGRAG